MSCHSTSAQFSNSAARRNGVWSQTSRYLNTLGNWNTYRDLKSLDQILARLGQVTQAMFGLSELGNVLQGKTPRMITGILATTLGVQALEQVTGNIATAGVRLVGQGKPVAKYRGLIIRQSPVIERKARLLNRITGGRVTQAAGYYFHDGGRTWHTQSYTTEVKGTPWTVTQVKSLGLPYREHYFDRPLTLNRSGEQATGDDSEKRSVYVQRVIDVIKGNNDPAAIPGYIGSTNELENATPLGGLKRAFFAANWFLVDESERDDPAAAILSTTMRWWPGAQPPISRRVITGWRRSGLPVQVGRPPAPDQSISRRRIPTAAWCRPKPPRRRVRPILTKGSRSVGGRRMANSIRWSFSGW
jgi:hypothetical protein